MPASGRPPGSNRDPQERPAELRSEPSWEGHVSDVAGRTRIDRRTVGLALLGIGGLGVVVSLVATAVALRFLGQLDTALEGSVGVAARPSMGSAPPWSSPARP
jgi:hypothetical protein